MPTLYHNWRTQHEQLSGGLAFIIIIAIHLENQTVSTRMSTALSAFNPTVTTTTHQTCLLGVDSNGNSLCTSSYVVAAFSLGVSLLISMLQCINCHLCGIGYLLDLLLAGCTSLLWLTWGLVLEYYSSEEAARDQFSDGAQEWVVASFCLAFVMASLFGVTFVQRLLHLAPKGRCGGRGGGGRGGYNEQDSWMIPT